jgi:deferrochelatase/peroxidase EfeB
MIGRVVPIIGSCHTVPREFDAAPFRAVGPNNGAKLLRRGYSYVDGIDRTSGAPVTGVLFLCYQRDPRHQFIPIQHQLAARDSLNQFISHIGSAIFACPPGAAPGGYVWELLLA